MERKYLLLLILFVKIIPKIIFRVESFPKFRHLLSEIIQKSVPNNAT